ncbi:MAG TPA: hypothetical protein VGF28_05330 [Thermoanaerobaculia bacterium]|jgi:hypothetical protein
MASVISRSAAIIVVAVTTAYFVAGYLLGVAAYQTGTTIAHYAPLDWAALPQEALRVPPAALVRFFPWLLGPLFAVTAGFAVAIAIRPSLAARATWHKASSIVALAGLVPFVLGAATIVFTLLNATVWGDLDGEWIGEFHSLNESFAVLFICFAALKRNTAGSRSM